MKQAKWKRGQLWLGFSFSSFLGSCQRSLGPTVWRLLFDLQFSDVAKLIKKKIEGVTRLVQKIRNPSVRRLLSVATCDYFILTATLKRQRELTDGFLIPPFLVSFFLFVFFCWEKLIYLQLIFKRYGKVFSLKMKMQLSQEKGNGKGYTAHAATTRSEWLMCSR